MREFGAVQILYIEDDAGLARLIEKRLRRDGIAVALANTGRNGLSMAAEGHYDAIVVDYNLPDLDGIEIIRKLNEAEEPPAVIMLTGAGNETVAVEAMKLGAADYVVKDAEANYLNLMPAIINRATEHKRLLDAKKQWELERERLIVELQEAMANVKRLSGLLPICSACKKVRDDQGYWSQVEVYIHEHSEAAFTHSICPQCLKKLYPQHIREGVSGNESQ